MFLSTENVDNYHMHHYAVTHFVTFFPNLPTAKPATPDALKIN